MEVLRIVKHGYNGNARFSLFLVKPPTPLITNKLLNEIVSGIVRGYPEIAEKVTEANQIMKGSDTGDINFSLVDCEDRAELVKQISIEFNAQQKKMAASK
ncbi:MAG: hypothetical protein WC719_01525 [Patescibacteria group bacterium]|jgi:hypothetical protein